MLQKKEDPRLNLSYFTWKDLSYRDFMLDVLQKLEPRCEEGGTVLLDELDESLEINFVTKGIVYAGY